MKKALLFLADGFEEVEALAPLDILRRAGINLLTVSVTGQKTVKSSHQVVIEADIRLEELSVEQAEADVYILPGGMPGSQTLADCQPLHNLLLQANANGKWIAAICAAPMVLGKLGLLAGKEAICYPGVESKLEGARISDQAVVKDSKVITAKGVGVAFDFGYAILKELADAETVEQLKAQMIYTNK
ncbi:DJ-1/PfpI family protein [Clostridiales bacterium COT073_COT-073]|nr:DJ-1/PfpI family protein [Clostridiales bacterium COT073_COT-073]